MRQKVLTGVNQDMVEIRFEESNNCAAAYDGNTQVGICQYKASSGKWVIYHTFTEPEYTGRGIARKMVECISGKAKEIHVELGATCWYAKKILNI